MINFIPWRSKGISYLGLGFSEITNEAFMNSSLFWEWPNARKTIFVTLNHITSITVACCFESDIMHNKHTTILFQVVLEDFHWWRSKKQLNIDSSWQCLSIAQWLQCLHLGELILIVNKYKLRRDKTHTAWRLGQWKLICSDQSYVLEFDFSLSVCKRTVGQQLPWH